MVQLTSFTLLCTLATLSSATMVIDHLSCPGSDFLRDTVADFNFQDYEDIFSLVKSMLSKTGTLGKAELGGCFVRTAAHDFLDFRQKRPNGNLGSHGMDGCFDMGVDENAGLEDCLPKIQEIFASSSSVNNKKICERVSLPDFLVIAGESVMATMASPTDSCNSQLKKEFMDNFRFGRTFCGAATGDDAALRDHEHAAHEPVIFNAGKDGLSNMTENLFGQFGNKTLSHFPKTGTALSSTKTRKDKLFAAALLGAHSLGKVNHASLTGGGTGWWHDRFHFDNSYYKALLSRGFMQTSQGNASNNFIPTSPNRGSWERCDSNDRKMFCGFPEQMLRIDLSLVYNVNATSNCCAHLSEGKGDSIRSLLTAESSDVKNANFPERCGDTKSCCGQIANASQCDVREGFGKITFDLAKSNKDFFGTFVQAWKVAVENGVKGQMKLREPAVAVQKNVAVQNSLDQCKDLAKPNEINQCIMNPNRFFPQTNDLSKECFWQNTNYVGFDVENFENIPTPTDCQLKCFNVQKCKHWSFDGANKVCFLKKSNSGRVSPITVGGSQDPTQFAGWVSGPKRCKCSHIHLMFNGKEVQEADVATRKKDCRNRCASLDGCLNYSWSKETKQCKLLANITSVAWDKKSRSGPQSCDKKSKSRRGGEDSDSEEEEDGEEERNDPKFAFMIHNDNHQNPTGGNSEPASDIVGGSSSAVISTAGVVLTMFFSI